MKLATEESYLRATDAGEEHAMRPVLTFVVGGESYGIDLLHVREIIKVVEVTEVPRMPPFVLGVISVRGVVIPVLDLRLRLRLDQTPLTRNARILVVNDGGDPYGLLCDAVTGVVRFVADEIEPTPSTLHVADVAFLAGIGRYQAGRRERMVILLNLTQVVTFEIRGRRKRETP